MGRASYFTSQGIPKYDCAFFRQNGASDDHYVGPYFTGEGAQLGWTTTYVDEYLLHLPSAFVKDGRLAPNAGNYSLLVVAEDPDAGQAQLTPTSASKLRDLADEGLPMLFLGNWTSPGSIGLSDASSTDFITEVKHLLSLSNVVNVSNSSGIPAGLEKLGLSPAVTHSASPLIHIRREHGEFDLYFFTANSSSTGVSQDVLLPIRHEHVAPLELDPWSGEVTLAGQYTIMNGRLKVGISLEPQQSKMLIVAPSSADVVHVVNSTADSIFRNSRSGQLFVRNGEAGDYTIVLSNGSQVITTFKAPLSALELTDWALDIDDWQPANENPSDDVEDIVATKLVHHSFNLTTLNPWSDIDGLQNVSGNATYSTEFVLGTADAPYGSDTGAYMELDMFQGSFRAKVNGKTLGSLDQMAHRFDVSKWLRNGNNTLEMEVATSLINRMSAFQPQYYEQYARQKYGLRSVTIRPFSQVAL
ncbi:alpha-L-rhamnosidase [Colletotrichum asianum]